MGWRVGWQLLTAWERVYADRKKSLTILTKCIIILFFALFVRLVHNKTIPFTICLTVSSSPALCRQSPMQSTHLTLTSLLMGLNLQAQPVSTTMNPKYISEASALEPLLIPTYIHCVASVQSCTSATALALACAPSNPTSIYIAATSTCKQLRVSERVRMWSGEGRL